MANDEKVNNVEEKKQENEVKLPVKKEEKKESKVEEVAKPVESPSNDQIVNTEALKVKTNETFSKAKDGIKGIADKLNNDKKLLVVVIAIALVIVLAVVVVIAFCLVGSSKSVANSYAKYYADFDASGIVELMNEDYVDYADSIYSSQMDTCKDSFYYSDDDCEEMYASSLKDYYKKAFKELKEEDTEVLKYEIVDTDKLDKRDVEDVAEYLDDAYGIDEDDVKAVVIYTIKFKLDVDGDKETEKTEVSVIKIEGKWYLFPGNVEDEID